MANMTVEGANDFLGLAVQDLGTETDPNTLSQLETEINRVLNGAIIEIPTEVNGVELALKVDTTRWSNDLYLRRGRDMAGAYIRSLLFPDSETAELQKNIELRVVRNLPYSDHYRISPSGDPVGTGNLHRESRTIKADLIRRDERTTPFIRVSQNELNPVESDAFFYPDEVVGLRLVRGDDSDFTKRVIPSGHDDRGPFPLEGARTPLWHYLDFRGFGSNAKDPEVYRKMGVRPEVVDEMYNVLVPQDDTDLFRRSGNRFLGYHADGFVIHRLGSQPVLHNFDKAKTITPLFKRADRTLVAATAVVDANEYYGRDHPVYHGRDIVAALAKVPLR